MSDVAAAIAAATTARLPVEANLPAIDAGATRADLIAAVAVVDNLARKADDIEAEVRQRLHQ